MPAVEAETVRARRAEVQARLRSLDRSFDDVVASIEDVGNDDEHDPDGSTIAFERVHPRVRLRAAEHSGDRVRLEVAAQLHTSMEFGQGRPRIGHDSEPNATRP